MWNKIISVHVGICEIKHIYIDFDRLYISGNNLRPAMDGSELPSARLLRTKILSDGYPEDHQFNTLATHFFVFSTVDVADLTVLRKFPNI